MCRNFIFRSLSSSCWHIHGWHLSCYKIPLSCKTGLDTHCILSIKDSVLQLPATDHPRARWDHIISGWRNYRSTFYESNNLWLEDKEGTLTQRLAEWEQAFSHVVWPADCFTDESLLAFEVYLCRVCWQEVLASLGTHLHQFSQGKCIVGKRLKERLNY